MVVPLNRRPTFYMRNADKLESMARKVEEVADRVGVSALSDCAETLYREANWMRTRADQLLKEVP